MPAIKLKPGENKRTVAVRGIKEKVIERLTYEKCQEIAEVAIMEAYAKSLEVVE